MLEAMNAVDPEHATPLAGMPPLASVCGHLLRRAQQVHNAIWFTRVGMDPTSPQYAVLEAITGAPGMDQRRVGEIASLDTSSTMDVVDRLSRRGWIERRRDPADGRRDILDPTAEAMAALIRLRPRVREVQEMLLEPLAEGERARFVQELARVARFDTEGSAVSPVLLIPGHLLRRAQQAHTALFAEEFDRELTGPQYAALQVVGENPGVSQRELGERAALDKSTAADLVRRLGRRGWVVQGIDPHDRRRRTLTLTPDARAACAAFSGRVLGIQDALLEPLDAQERTHFLAALAPIAYPSATAA
jgi:DNA-binding MarR family transcriptional regulator